MESVVDLPVVAVRVEEVDWTSLLEGKGRGEQRESRTEGEGVAQEGENNDGHGTPEGIPADGGEGLRVGEPLEEVDALQGDREPEPIEAGTLDHPRRVKQVLDGANVNLEELMKLSWRGLQKDTRPTAWKLLLGYLPVNTSRRSESLDKKRRSYGQAVDQYWKSANWSQDEERIFRQIDVDMPRTCPEHQLFHVPDVQDMLRRVLFVWAVKHPASGYVQGMNDLVSPFIYVFLLETCPESSENLLSRTSLEGMVTEEQLGIAEADSYFCFTALLETIQDYYTFAQPGIQRRVHYLEDFIGRVDPTLREHLQGENLEFLQFSFRWLNCLLMRELPFELMIRVWDTYMSEPDGFAVFHVYVCAALLSHFSSRLKTMDFQELVIFLQNLPTEDWTTEDIDMLLSQAFLWRTVFNDKSLVQESKS